MNYNKIEFDRKLIENCQTNAPRYTSYPTADRFSFDFNRETQLEQLKKVFTPDFNQAISLYIHIPFCNTLCLYCGCNKIITNNRNQITIYLEYLAKEFALYGQLLNGKKLPVIQLHFGGGSPSWLSINEVETIMQLVHQHFDLDNVSEIAMELDPRHVTDEFVDALYGMGFNRVSLGVQDLDYKVQKAVNRVQPLEDTLRVLNKANQLGFKSTSIDLIYGLPLQTVTGFAKTIDTVIKEIRPARIALFNYAHIPQLFMSQTRIKEEDLPSSEDKLTILQESVEKLAAAGYKFIGMDHFALPDDELAIALENGSLQRNFQGYSTFADTHMLSFGVSSIGFIGNSYYQNVKDLDSYYLSIDNRQLPVLRGLLLDNDDIIRRYIIQQIMCQFSIEFADVKSQFAVEFSDYFANEIPELEKVSELGLIEIDTNGFNVTNKGRFLIRNVAMIFDKYLRQKRDQSRYSKVI